jgi:hypothetical protein
MNPRRRRKARQRRKARKTVTLRFSWSSIEVRINGEVFKSMKSIAYSDRVVGRTKGRYTVQS